MIEKLEITARDLWLQWRKQDVTANAVGALFNCHPYITPLRLYAEKRGTEFLNEDNATKRRGRWLEPAVAKAVEETRPEWRLEPARHYLRDSELRLGATVDFDIHGDPRGPGTLEAKTVVPLVYERDWANGSEVPLWIILQAATQAMLAGVDFFVVAALLVDAHNMDVSIQEFRRNISAEDKIRNAVRQFWDKVAAGIEPEPDFARDADTIKAIWRAEADPPIKLDFSGNNHIPELLADRCLLKQVVKDAEDRLELIDAEIKYEMKDAAIATGIDGFRLTFKTSHVKEFTVPAHDRRVLRVTDQREKQLS
jgi:predicted phage-related endonuclease